MPPSPFLLQRTHLTAPATVPRYVDSAVLRSDADLVMLDLEDSIPRGDDALLVAGRHGVVRALCDLDWGAKLRFFRPRGAALDPGHTDIVDVVSRAGERVQGLIYPKVESANEVRAVDATLAAVERKCGLPVGHVRIGVLIESVLAEERAFEIAAASKRIVSLIFGAFDYFRALGVVDAPSRCDHPLIDGARARIVRAAASVGVQAIAEMTVNFPTRDKSPEAQAAALGECRRDAERAKSLGFRGKWAGIPSQVAIINSAFALSQRAIDDAVTAARAFMEAERLGRGAAMIDGKMTDRATDRVQRVVLETAFALGRLSQDIAHELGIGGGGSSEGEGLRSLDR